MKKLYLFGDSFSLMNSGIMENSGLAAYIENNSHSSLSNDHILKLVKLKLIKLIKSGIQNVNILIQFTIPNRLCVIYNEKFPEYISNENNLKYNSPISELQDLEIFEEKMYCSLYPFSGITKDLLVKELLIPYTTLIVKNNFFKLLKDWILEVKILYFLAKENNIKLEYFFYTNDYDLQLKNEDLDSFHLKFEEYNSMETFLKKNGKSNFFVSSSDKHFNNEGNNWYAKFLKERYDI